MFLFWIEKMEKKTLSWLPFCCHVDNGIPGIVCDYNVNFFKKTIIIILYIDFCFKSLSLIFDILYFDDWVNWWWWWCFWDLNIIILLFCNFGGFFLIFLMIVNQIKSPKHTMVNHIWNTFYFFFSFFSKKRP